MEPGVANLVAYRLNKGLTVRQAAEEIGVNQRTLARAEQGAGLHPSTAKLIADFYGIKVTDFVPVPEVRRVA